MRKLIEDIEFEEINILRYKGKRVTFKTWRSWGTDLVMDLHKRGWIDNEHFIKHLDYMRQVKVR